MAIAVHIDNLSPTQAIGLPLTKTLRGLAITVLVCVRHRLPGVKCGVDRLPDSAAGRPLIKTSELPVDIEKPLQCGIPRSPTLAAAGIVFPFLIIVEISVPTGVFLDAAV